MKTFSITDVGMVRKMNQDYVFCCENPIGRLSNLFIVADGMGGHRAGDFASKCCVDSLISMVETSNLQSPVSILEQGIQKANASVYQASAENEALQGMGTTIVAATVLGNEMYIANVGDSRLYKINNSISQITEDHSLVEEMIRHGDIDRKEARLHPNKNVITRAIGISSMVQIDFFEVSVEAGDIFLMCTDGLSNMIEDEEIFEVVKSYEKVDRIGKELIRMANANGGKDNIGLVLIQI
ncbi:MAG: Stp1/IreP family PP2C-type Ser/Thr phosphatase [Lachnospiraceae bacterium]|nr:Stp1/IreP family PP2C-type Ser/Thr phosphatase [Lachnospiraceae bacterium]